MKNNMVVILGASATALAIVRELSKLNDLKLVIAYQERGAACVSKYVDENWCFSNLKELLNKIIDVSLLYNIALIPSSDVFVEFICHNNEYLEKYCHFDKCYTSLIALKFLDKDVFSKIVNDNDKFIQPKNHSAIDFNLLEKSNRYFPLFIKPKVIHKKRDSIPGQKGVIVESNENWEEWYQSNINELDDWLVQEIITGSEDNIMLFVGYIDNSFNCTISYSARKLRQYPAGFGSASMVMTENNAEITKLSIELLKYTNYQGICSGELKWCSDRKKYVIIEFNPRPALWYSSSTESGCNIVTESVCKLLHIKPFLLGSDRKVVVWKYGLKDLFSRFFYMNKKNFILPPPPVNKYLNGLDFKRIYPVFKFFDIKPMFYEIKVYLMKAIKRLKGFPK